MNSFGPYELAEPLGVGGMAETFIATRHGPGGFAQRVCLKRILSGHEEDPDFVRLFLEEARVTATLRHANIACVLDFGEQHGSHYLVLELIEGRDLRSLLRRVGTLAPDIVAYLAFELGAALEYAHGHGEGIIHRDISPSNVLLSRAGEVKLSDFGIAKALSVPSFTRSGVVKGKVPYMAPEYARRGLASVASDLFALGVSLYEALAGVRPFGGTTDLDTLERIMGGDYVPLAERTPNAPPILMSAIERLLCPAPDDRFASAAALLDALAPVAPAPTARRALASLIGRALKPESGLPYEATELATPRTPDETQHLGRRRLPRAPTPRAAAPDAETRTLAPIQAGPALPPTQQVQRPAPDEATRSAEAQTRSPRGVWPALLGVVALAVAAIAGYALFAY